MKNIRVIRIAVVVVVLIVLGLVVARGWPGLAVPDSTADAEAFWSSQTTYPVGLLEAPDGSENASVKQYYAVTVYDHDIPVEVTVLQFGSFTAVREYYKQATRSKNTFLSLTSTLEIPGTRFGYSGFQREDRQIYIWYRGNVLVRIQSGSRSSAQAVKAMFNDYLKKRS